MESQIIWVLAIVLGLALFLPYLLSFRRTRRADAARRREAVTLGMDRPLGQYPQIDINRCVGCGTCVQACPEGDVLGIVSGRAVVINGVRCIGHGHCADACSVEAITVGLGDIKQRDDIPQLSEDLETSVPGIYIAGELGGFALIRNAITQGRVTVEALARYPEREQAADRFDVAVVGAGPAGLSAALAAQEHGLRCLLLDQQGAGGTILQYPRRKLVMVQPVDIPLYGQLNADEYEKEELLEIWLNIQRQFRLELRAGERVEAIGGEQGRFRIRTQYAEHLAHQVVLAMGRRGSPRKLGVPCEDLSKVAYKLVDAASYQGQRILVVGGGDSAVEAAMGLAKQSGNEVTLSYRKQKLMRIKQRNQERLEPYLSRGQIRFLGNSQVTRIHAREVELTTLTEERTVPNDHVFIFAGGVPPFPLLRQIGVAFGGAQRDPAPVSILS